jgi:uncharacterized protein (TIGR03546 family)
MLGWQILHIAQLEPLLTTMYNTPFVSFTRFNNTLVAGGLTAGVLLFFPVFVIIVLLIPVYRNTLLPKLMKNSVIQALGKFPLFEKIGGTMKFLSGDDIGEVLNG